MRLDREWIIPEQLTPDATADRTRSEADLR